jgi:hypothetical protein
MILYNIQHFGDISWLPWLIRILQHSENQFLITIDGDCEKVTDVKERIYQNSISARNIIVEKSPPIYWCGPSQAKMYLSVLQKASEIPDWQYFINLSGACAPLATQSEIFDVLNHDYSMGYKSHLSFFQVNKEPSLSAIDNSGIWSVGDVGRLRLLAPPNVLSQFSDPLYFPVRNVENRPLVACSEVDEKLKILKVFRPDDAEVRFRKNFFSANSHYAGRAWYIFSRDSVERILKFYQSEISCDWRHIFLNSFEPDESYMTTALLNFKIIPKDWISGRSYRSFGGEPRHISDANINDVSNRSDWLFARKIDHENASKLREVIERRVLGTAI